MTQAARIKPRLTASKTVHSTTRTGNTGSINFYYICGSKDKIWIDRASSDARSNPTPFRFTGKERDPETGLMYFGARYFDAKTSRWISSDPALGEYVPLAPLGENERKHNSNLPGMGGVYNVVNLHVYHYAGNNPVKYVDPDGRETTIIITRGNFLDLLFLGGSHVALHLSNPSGLSPVFWDPGGSYEAWNTDGSKIEPGTDRIFTDSGSDLLTYIQYQLTTGGENTVTTYTFNTTPEQEATLLQRMDKGDWGPGLCAFSVSSILRDLGIGLALRPKGFDNQIPPLFASGDVIWSNYTLHKDNGQMFIKKTDYYFDENQNMQTSESLIPMD